MHRCAVGAKESRAHEIVVISWALRWCVLGGVLLSRTLAGAVPSALSGLASGFGMDTGRFPVAVTTETTTWAVRQCSCDSVIGPPVNAHCVWLVVGLGVDRIVDARAYRITHPPVLPRTLGVWCVGVLLFVLAY